MKHMSKSYPVVCGVFCRRILFLMSFLEMCAPPSSWPPPQQFLRCMASIHMQVTDAFHACMQFPIEGDVRITTPSHTASLSFLSF